MDVRGWESKKLVVKKEGSKYFEGLARKAENTCTEMI